MKEDKGPTKLCVLWPISKVRNSWSFFGVFDNLKKKCDDIVRLFEFVLCFKKMFVRRRRKKKKKKKCHAS